MDAISSNEIYDEYDEEIEILVYPKKPKKTKHKNILVANTDIMQHFTQSQSHGLYWDNEIRVKVFQLGQCINDTKKYDIDANENKFDSLENVSIKTSSSNNIDCSDILRFFNSDFTKKYYKCVKEVLEIAYTQSLRDHLFGTATLEVLEQYVNFVKSIPSGPVLEDIKKSYKAKKIALQKDHNMVINISPKVDSKSQRRVQCSIPKVEQLLEQFPEILIFRSSIPIVRNVPISAQIQSAARVRNKKVKNVVEQIQECEIVIS
jgi:hypothetical protein